MVQWEGILVNLYFVRKRVITQGKSNGFENSLKVSAASINSTDWTRAELFAWFVALTTGMEFGSDFALAVNDPTNAPLLLP